VSLRRADVLLGTSALLALAALGVALVSQHVYDQQPCPWCVLQRLIFLALAAAAGVGLAWRSRLGQGLGAGGAAALAIAGVATALWHHFVAASSVSCNLSFADKLIAATGLDRLLPEVFAAYASCADAPARLLGVNYELYALALFIVLGAMALAALRRRA